MTTTAGSLALVGSIAAARRVRRPAAARGGRGDPRQDQPQRVGQLPLARARRAAGARAAGRRRTPTRSTATPAARAPAPARPSAANLCAVAVGHRDGRLDRLPVVARTRSSGSSRRSAWSAARASSPSRTARTRPGPMARTVADAAVLLGALAGADPRDAGDRRRARRGAGRLHAVPRPGRPARRAHRRRCARPFGFNDARRPR